MPAPAFTQPPPGNIPFEHALRALAASGTPPAPASPSQLPFTTPVEGSAPQDPRSPLAATGAQTQAQPQGQTSLPSTEKEGAREGELSAGAGALPGQFEEQSVGLAPDERGVFSESRDKFQRQVQGQTSLPSTERESAKEDKLSTGTGSLSNKKCDEQGVGIAPEEHADTAEREVKKEKEEDKTQEKKGGEPQAAGEKTDSGDPGKPGHKGQANKVSLFGSLTLTVFLQCSLSY